jgi:hypothetical protein
VSRSDAICGVLATSGELEPDRKVTDLVPEVGETAYKRDPAYLEAPRRVPADRAAALAGQLADVAGPLVQDRQDLVAGIRHQANIDPRGAEIAEAFQLVRIVRSAADRDSGAGAVPVAFDYRASKPEFSLTPELAFDDAEAIETVEKFILHMWSGSREPAKIYIQEFGLPIILTFAGDGTYRKAMSSMEDMQQFAEHLGRQVDDAANMDW